MKTLLIQIYRELFTKKVLATAAVIASFIFISTAGFNALMDDTNAAPGCDPSKIQVHSTGHSGNESYRDGIEVNGDTASATVTNTGSTDCTVTLVSYETFVGWGVPEYLSTQERFEFTKLNVAAGATQTLNVELPNCNYQVDLLVGDQNPPETNPDFANLPQYNLLRWWGIHDAGLCGTPPPPECPNNSGMDLVFDKNGVFNDNDPFAEDVIKIKNNGTRAEVTVTNTSDCQSYRMGLASYEITKPAPAPGDEAARKEFIRTQILFDKDVKTVGPNQTATFIVDLPQCAWQVDFFIGDDAPAIPDFEELEQDGTHDLLDAVMFWDVNPNLPICGFVEDQCPVNFVAPTITGASTLTVNPGSPVNYSFTVAGSGTKSVTVTGLAGTGLTFNANSRTVTGTMPNQPVTFTINVIATDTGTGLVCGQVSKTVTINPGQCPANFTNPVITGPNSVDVSVGAQVNYLFSVSGPGTKVINVSGLSGTGLAFNGSNRITGTMPNQAVTFTITVTATDTGTGLVCGQTTKTVTLNPEICPLNPPDITSAATASGRVGQAFSYTITATGGSPITYSIQSGTLPAGLTFNPTTRTISGTPTQATTKTVILRAENECGFDTLSLTIDIVAQQCPIDFVAPLINGQASGQETLERNVGSSIDYPINVTGSGTKNINVTGLSGTGLVFNGTNRITGTMPNQTVVINITVVASDIPGTGLDCGTATRTVTLTPKPVNDQCPADFEAPVITSGSEIDKIKAGTQINYLVTFTEGDGDVEVEVTDLPNWLTFNENTNRVTGVVPERGNYSFKIELTSEEKGTNRVCATDTQTVNLKPDGPGGRCINCDDDDEPRVLARSTRFTPDEPGEVLESFVVLTQIPATGVGSFFETILFTVGLLVLSALIAYFIMSRSMREKFANVFAGGSALAGGSQYEAYEQYDSPVRESTADIATAYPFGAVAMPSREASRDLNVDHRITEIKNRNNPMNRGTGSEDFGQEIAQGLEELAAKKEAEEADDVFAKEIAGDTSALEARIEEKAREDNALISDDGVKLIVTASNANEKNAFAILDQLLRVSENWYEREEGWLLLNKTKIKDVLFATYLTMTPVFIGWMAEGNEKNVFGFLRMLRSQGHSVKEFIKHAVYELDSLYRERTDGNAEVDPHTVKVARGWNAKTIEKMIAILIGAVDETYSEELTSIKIAVLKALSLAKEEKVQSRLLSSGK